MAVASGVYIYPFKAALSPALITTGGPFDYLNDVMKGALVTNTVVPDFDSVIAVDYTWATGGSEFGNEAVDPVGDYAAGGVTLTGKTLDVGAVGGAQAADFLYFTGDWAARTGSTLSANGMVIYNDDISNPVKPMLCMINFGSTIASTAGTYTVTLHVDGFIQMDLVP